MTRHLTPATLANWLAAVSAAAVFFGVLYQVDRADAEAQRLHTLATQAEAAEQRMHRAAQALCSAELGPGSTVLWTPDGDLVCRPALMTAHTPGAAL